MRHSMLNSRQMGRASHPTGSTVSSEYLRLVQLGLESRGLPMPALLSQSGIDPGVLDQRGKRIPHEATVPMWARVAEQLGDPSFGLQLVDALPLGTGDLMDYLILSSADVMAALQSLLRYTPLLCDGDRSAIVVSGNLACLRFRMPDILPYPRELAIGLFARRSREMFGRAWTLKHVSFTHPPLGASVHYERMFQVPVYFGMPFDEVVFARDLLAYPMAGADPRLNAILRAQADTILATLNPPAPEVSFVEAVQQAVHDGLADGNFSLTHLADRLGLSVRTLQRRLQTEGLTHRELIRTLRHDLAARALDAPVSQGEIARTLGYSGVGSFHRAFKTWSGMTPGQVRAGATRSPVRLRGRPAARRDDA